MIRACLLALLAWSFSGPAPTWAQLETAAEKTSRIQRLPEHGIFSELPAKIWQEAMLTGNGTLGAMVFGDPIHERIVLNHERLYEPLLDRPCPVPNASDALKKTRELYLAGKYKEGYQHYFNACKEAGFPGIQWTDPYHPACALTVERNSKTTKQGYFRSTNFQTGEVSVSWSEKANLPQSQSFVSRADGIVVHRFFNRSENSSSTLQLVNQDRRSKNKRADKFGGGYQDPAIEVQDGWVIYSCKYDRSKRGYVVVMRSTSDGVPTKVAPEKSDGLLAKQGQTIALIDIRSLESFGDKDTAIAEMKQKLSNVSADYDKLLKRHVAVHRPMFDRVQLRFASAKPADLRSISSEQLIAAQEKSVETDLNPVMLQKMFEMGRYTLISSSGEWPPNLMGIWNGDWRPKWSGDFTLDANVNLQIAAANIGNLSEAVESYDRLIQGLLPDWRTNAKNLYGCRGLLSGCRTDGRHNLHTHYSEGFPGCSRVSGAQWLVLPMFEHYQVSGDKKYLKEKLLPVLREIALFYEDYLATTEDKNGMKVFVPSYSPENKPSNVNSYSVVNATMDIACCKEVLTQLLSLKGDIDLTEQERRRYQSLLNKLPSYMTNEDGALKEWAHADLQDRYDHRHVSHLYPVWPGHEINPEDTPELFTAAKKGRGNGSAHGLAHMALIGARLKDADLVEGNLRFMLGSGFVLPSFGTYHNIGRIYNLDMLNSLPAVVLEMLVYSKPGKIELLPALPKSMPTGSITGVSCRNQCVIKELKWDMQREIVTVSIESKIDQTITLRMRQKINTQLAGEFAFDAIGRLDDSSVEIELRAGELVSYTYLIGNRR